MTKGLFIAIEGVDGSGKKTHAEKLAKRLKTEGKNVFKISFPQYGKPPAKIIEMYLNGAFGKAGSTPPELTSLAYAIDRFAASKIISEKLAAGTIVIADRYVASNLAHQAAQIDDAEKRKEFYEYLMEVEYGILGIPRPDLNIVLSVPTNIAQSNVDKKDRRGYTDKKRDILEIDTTHLEKAKRDYNELCELYPNEFTKVECEVDGALRAIPEIHTHLAGLVSDLLNDD